MTYIFWREKSMGFKRLYQKVKAAALVSEHKYVPLAVLGLISFPLYHFVWLYFGRQGFESLGLRILGFALCLLLALKNYWPVRVRFVLPLYWYFTICYTLSFYFAFMLFKNNDATAWLMTLFSGFFLLLLLTDLVSAVLVFSLGLIFAWFCYVWTTSDPHSPIEFLLTLPAYLTALVAGGFFIIKDSQLHASKEKAEHALLELAEQKSLHLETLRANMARDLHETQIERDFHQNLAIEQEKFVKIANQVVHDVRSPLSSLLMIVKCCAEIPETYRIALREAAISIGDIANNLLNQYQSKETESPESVDICKTMLVSAVLLEVLTEKKYQYHHSPAKFDYEFNQEGYFAFIEIQPSAFRRTVSNLINNSVDAFEGKAGKVTVKLQADKEQVKIIIEDNGKGMPKEIADKILQNVAVTYGKSDGHGIGLSQVRETLQRHKGEMGILSEINHGTQIILTFPRVHAPSWTAEVIRLLPDDWIIILDDDTSIHRAWETRFEAILAKYPELKLKHFDAADETIKFIESLPEQQRKKIFLLTDFELLKQELTGLHVVEKTKIPRSILVTSHYANKDVLEQAARLNTKILPKQLASEILIDISDSPQDTEITKTVDVIIVDDDIKFTKLLKEFIFKNKEVKEFQDPFHFLENVSKYSKQTKIYLDCNFATDKIKGVDVARQLHEQGYTRLYLLTGETLNSGELPDYLMVLRKDDIDGIMESQNR